MPLDQKHAARALARASLAGLAKAQRGPASAALCTRVGALPEWRAARVRMAFVPAPSEPDIWPLVVASARGGARVALPRTNWSDRSMGAAELASVDNLSQDLLARQGVLEAAPHLPALAPEAIDVVLVPGVAFDMRGGRVGRGAGFYDRFLASMRAEIERGPYARSRERGVLVGVCFDEQMLDEVPMEAQDVRMDVVITPTRTCWAPSRWMAVGDG